MNWLSTIFNDWTKPFKWWIVIASWEAGLRIRLGKKAKRLNPGLHFKIPFLDRLFVQSIRLRTITRDNLNTTTKDGKTISICIAIDFAIADIEKLYDTLSSPETTINARVSEAIVHFIAATKLEELKLKNICEIMSQAAWKGLDGIFESTSVRIIGFSVCRTHRLLQNDYAQSQGLYSLDNKDSDGERK